MIGCFDLRHIQLVALIVVVGTRLPVCKFRGDKAWKVSSHAVMSDTVR